MTTHEIIESIKNKCAGHERTDIVNEINLKIRSGTTGNEIIGLVGKYLFDLKKSEPKLYSFIKEDVERYVSYCQSIGIIIN